MMTCRTLLGHSRFKGGKNFEKSGRFSVRIFGEKRLPICAARVTLRANNCFQIGKGGEDDSTDSRRTVYSR